MTVLNFVFQQGGLGGLKYPLLADFSKNIAREYGVLIEKAGVALRFVFLLFVKLTSTYFYKL